METKLAINILEKTFKQKFDIERFEYFLTELFNDVVINTVEEKQFVKDNKELFDLAKQMIENKEIIVGQLINEYNYNWVHISIPDGKHKNQILAIK